MKDTNIIFNNFAGCFRSFPITIFFIMLLKLIISPKISLIYDIIIILIGGLSNLLLLKPLTKKMYDIIGIKKLPILGLGVRPSGAHGCSDFYNCNDFCKKNPSMSFGMPSGHSQIAWTFSIYYICEIWNKNKLINRNLKIVYYKMGNVLTKFW